MVGVAPILSITITFTNHPRNFPALYQLKHHNLDKTKALQAASRTRAAYPHMGRERVIIKQSIKNNTVKRHNQFSFLY